MVYSNLGLIPPRLPEPPEEIDKRYMLDLVRAVQIFISQSNEKDNFNIISFILDS